MQTNKRKIFLLNRFAPQIETTSKLGRIGAFILLLIFVTGLYALVIQLIKGHIVTGMRDHVVWGVYIVNFIFFIGISYAGALISGILHLLKVEWRIPIIRIAEIITVIATIMGPFYILLCIGRFDRLHYMVLYGRIQSPITWDIIAISTYLIGSIIFLYLALIRDFAFLRDSPNLKLPKWRKHFYKFMAVNYKDKPKQRQLLNRLLNIMAALIIPLAVIVHSVLSWIFGMTLRPGWHSTIFAPYFVVAAVYSGTGVLIVVMWVFRKFYRLEAYITTKHFNYLGIILLVLAGLYGYFTFSEYLTSWYGSETWELNLLDKLFKLSEYGWFFIFAAFVGVLTPIIIIGVPWFRTINSITFASLVAVVAMWVKRYLIIIPTLETPLLPIQDTRPEYLHYMFTWVEVALTISGTALFCLIFFLFSKLIPIIPVTELAESSTALEKETT